MLCEEYSAVQKYKTLYRWRRLGVYSNRKLYYPSEQLRCINSTVSLLLLLFLLHLLAALPPSAKRGSAAASDGLPWDSPRLAAYVCVGWETSFGSLANLSSVLHTKKKPSFRHLSWMLSVMTTVLFNAVVFVSLNCQKLEIFCVGWFCKLIVTWEGEVSH